MNLIINKSGEHNDYFTFTDDADQEYQWHKRKDIEVPLEKILFLIRKREYPEHPNIQSLETMEEWINDGALDSDGDPVEKVPWTSTHPKVKNKIIDVIEIDQSAVDLYQQIKTQATADNNQLGLGILQLLKKILWG